MFSHHSLKLPHTGGRRSRPAAAEPIRTGLLRFAAFELAVWASMYAAYLAVRGATIGSPAKALANGRDIIALERALGIFHEAQIQQALSTLERLFSVYYMVGFAPLIVTTLVWLGLCQPQRYRELRTTLLISISLATVVFIVFPAAPPRLIPGLGIADTVGLSGHDSGSFAGIRFNPYAAMPSMHVGWSLLVGLAGFRAARRRFFRLFFVAHPVVMVLAVTATGNHFALDAIAGAAIASAVAALVYLRLGRLRLRSSLSLRQLHHVQGGWNASRTCASLTMPAIAEPGTTAVEPVIAPATTLPFLPSLRLRPRFRAAR